MADPQFVAALRAAREDAGLSIASAAELIGVSHNALGSWELGRRKKRLAKATVERLQEIYGVADDRLLRAGGYIGAASPPASGRGSLSYRGDSLTPGEEQAVLEYIEFLRSKRRS